MYTTDTAILNPFFCLAVYKTVYPLLVDQGQIGYFAHRVAQLVPFIEMLNPFTGKNRAAIAKWARALGTIADDTIKPCFL